MNKDDRAPPDHIEQNGDPDQMIGQEKNGNEDILPSEQPPNDKIVTNEDPERAISATINNDNNTPWSVWTPKQRRMIVLASSFASLLSPLSSQIYFPALDTIAIDLHVSDSLVNLSITTYLLYLELTQAIANFYGHKILQGIAPTFTAQLSDTAGRRPSYIVCFILYMASNIGLGAQNSYAALMVLRCLQSAGSSGTVALANAVVTDLTTSAERGIYVSWASAVPMLAPSIGPVIGGLLAQYLGWHSIFWFLLILSGVVAVPMSLFLPETCRKIVGDGSIPPPKWNKCYTNVQWERKALRDGKSVPYDKRDELARTRRIRFPNPFATIVLLLQRECGYALLYSAALCCSFYATLALIPSQFTKVYGFNEVQISLCYIPFGVGALLAAFSRGRMIDSGFRRHAKRLGVSTESNRQTDLTDFPIERARLEVAVPTILLGSGCIIGFGWTVQYQTNLAGPLILLFVIAFCLSASMNCIAVLMLDLYPGKAGTVTASNNLLRCLLGAGATALIVPMINKMGIGWAISFWALLNLAAMPVLWYIMKEGPKWRAETHQKKLNRQAGSTNQVQK